MVGTRWLLVSTAILLWNVDLVMADDEEDEPPAPPDEKTQQEEEEEEPPPPPPPPPPPATRIPPRPPVINPIPPPPPLARVLSGSASPSTTPAPLPVPDTTQEQLDHQLHVAANNQLVDLATEVLSKRANVNNQDSHGWTPLHCALMHAAERGHDPSPVIDLLMKSKADVNILDTRGRPPLFFAAQTGRGHILDSYFKDVKDPNPGNLVLRHATESGHGEIVSRLLSLGADTDVGTFDIHLMRRLKGLVNSHKDVKLPERMMRRLAEVPDEIPPRTPPTPPPPRVEQRPIMSSLYNAAKGEDL